MASINPRILVIGVEKDSDYLIQNIIMEGGHRLSSKNLTEDNRIERDWQINNKYYKADVTLSGYQFDCQDSTKLIPIFDRVEMIVVYFNNEMDNLNDSLDILNKYCNQYNVDIKLIVCDHSSNINEDINNKLSKWSIDNDFELVNLTLHEEEKINDDENDSLSGLETYGIKRIIEASQVHIWSNAKMHGKENDKRSTLSEEQQVDEFMNLYAQLNSIKQSIQSMPRSAQLHCAERVLNTFWNAIDGDSDELSDYEDGDSDQSSSLDVENVDHKPSEKVADHLLLSQLTLNK